MPDANIIRVLGAGRLIESFGAYWKVDSGGAVVDVYRDNLKIAEPQMGQHVVLTHEYGRNGLVVTCCRADADAVPVEGE